jgi:tetratricopeptide (TPR) repeat protein
MIKGLRSLRIPALAGIFVVAALLLGGCATPQIAALDAQWPAGLAARVELTQVPFYPQEEHQCGPASLAMVAGVAGVTLNPDALVEQVYLPGRAGSLSIELTAASRRNGLLPYPLRPQVEDLMREVAAGHPVLVLQNLAFAWYPLWHYAVVIGFDRERNVLVLRSGRTERLEMSLFTFERTWARGDYWAMVALAPGQLPVTAQATPYLDAAAALERVNPAAAQQAYAAALAQWPQERMALLGLGNTAYALGQRDAAIAAYRVALERHADFADAWNNLAQALLDAGRRDEAAQAIAQAVALGGARLPRYQELQQAIERN